MSRLRDRLLAGDHHGCATWEEAAIKLGVNDRTLRAMRKILRDTGHTVLLVPEGFANHNADKPITSVISRWPSVAEFDRDVLGHALTGGVAPSIGALSVNTRLASTTTPVSGSGSADEVLLGAVRGDSLADTCTSSCPHERANGPQNLDNVLCEADLPAPQRFPAKRSGEHGTDHATHLGHFVAPTNDIFVGHVDIDNKSIRGDVALSLDDSGKPGDPFRRMPKLGSINTHSGYGYENSDSSRIVTNSHRAPKTFDASTFRDESAVHPAPYEPPVVASIKRLTKAECPDGTMILWASDIHIPIHHDRGCRLMVECAEKVGVTRVVLGGDGLDMNCLSKHAKESKRTVEHATILEEVEPGRWLLDWFASKETDYVLGNHEDRLKRFVDENPAFHGSLVSNFAKVCELPSAINVLPQAGEIHLGNLAMVHGDAEFKNSSGGKYPAAKLLEMFPDRSTICGHLHRMATACRTTADEDGIHRTRKAWTMGHMSIEEMHHGYVRKNPNWQMGFALIRVYWEGERPRWSVYPIEILFDRYNRPYFEFQGTVFR